MEKMQLIQKGNWNKPLSISELLEKKGCDEFTLLEEKLEFDSSFYEIWWYSYRERNHILAKQCSYPYTLYFFFLEPGDLFRVRDFQTYMKTGKLIEPTVKMYIHPHLYT